MITILIPTLDWYKADETARMALDCAGVRAEALIELDTDRQGFTKTVNRGLRKRNGDDIVLFNDDCKPSDNWLLNLYTEMQRFYAHRAWFVGPSGPCRTIPQNSGRPGDKRRSRLVQHLSGFCMLIHRDVISAFGELDSRFIHYGSDVDLQRRAAKHYKARSLWVPSVFVDHELHQPHMEWWNHDQELLRQKWR
jgi:GT2 family glycosyltransferase